MESTRRSAWGGHWRHVVEGTGRRGWKRTHCCDLQLGRSARRGRCTCLPTPQRPECYTTLDSSEVAVVVLAVGAGSSRRKCTPRNRSHKFPPIHGTGSLVVVGGFRPADRSGLARRVGGKAARKQAAGSRLQEATSSVTEGDRDQRKRTVVVQHYIIIARLVIAV